MIALRYTLLIALAVACCGAADKEQSGLRAFREVASVLTSPRCLNCHVPGDMPLQGDDNHVHNMMVARGADGRGTPAMRCAGCHQTSNSAANHAPPGAPGWRMPGVNTPMAWTGLTTVQLCRVLKDPATNGKRSMNDLIEHITADGIVQWGWNPGPDRTLPPLSHAAFVQAFKEWAAAGAPCPAAGPSDIR